jgi:hypothetical protein
MMSYLEVRQQLDKILDNEEILDLELIVKRPMEKSGDDGEWSKVSYASDCLTIVLLGHVRNKGQA